MAHTYVNDCLIIKESKESLDQRKPARYGRYEVTLYHIFNPVQEEKTVFRKGMT